jgi:hypothetical protein
MSGRSLHERDGKLITNRKTDRRQSPARPLRDHLEDFALKGDQHFSTRVRLAFMLPKSIEPMVTPGSYDGGLDVVSRGFVRITSWSAEKCFARAQEFFRDVAKDKPGFSVTAVILNVEQPGRYCRYLSVVRGALVVSSGFHEPKVFEAA